jgi:putative toxin-antitoxin system antitoxin component (TIGR02293 family)
LVELAKMANDIFASEEDAFAWMRKSHPMLDGDSPFQAAKTSFGAQSVKDILLAIKYGGAV